MKPPTKGPNTPPASALAPIMPYAMGSFFLGNKNPAAAIEIGTNAPPPIDWINLVAKIQFTFGSLWKIFEISGLNAVKIEPIKKIINEAKNKFLKPNLSESLPVKGIIAVYPIK